MNAVEFIDLDGLKLAYRDVGQGKPLLLLHGFTYSSYSFRHNIPILSKFARVVCPDLVGHGRSDKPAKFDYRLSNQAKVMQRFCEKLGIAKIDLGGCSMGGALAIQMAVTYPELVERLILVDSAGIDRDLKSTGWLLELPLLGSLAALIATIRFRKSTEYRMLKDEEKSPEFEQYIAELNSFSSLMGGVKNLRANATFRISDIGRISQRTLVLWGERDKLFSPDTARSMAATIPNARLILLPEAGHLPNEEKPADFNQVVIDFLLERIPAAT
jgi:pimeloyl-ACP methyl ester carboxylesterase